MKYKQLTPIQATISQYMRASAGTANHPTDHTIVCFIGMIQTGEADVEDFADMGYEWVVEKMAQMITNNPELGELRKYE